MIETRNGETVGVIRSVDSEDLKVDSTATLDGTDSSNLQSTITVGKVETGGGLAIDSKKYINIQTIIL